MPAYEITDLSSLVDWFTSLGETFDSEDNKRMRNTTIDVRIDFPALDSAAACVLQVIAYLKERESTQAQVDAMAAKVTELTNRLQNSGTGLEETVKDNK